MLIPISYLISIFIFLTVNNKLLALFITSCSSITSSVIVYLLINSNFGEFIKRRTKNNDYFKILVKEAHKKPWKTSFLGRLVILPECYKDVLLSLIDLKFLPYFISTTIVSFYIRFEIFLILKNLKNIKYIFLENNKLSNHNLN